MGTSDITVRPYDGSLASLNIGGLINQSVLNDLDPAVTGTINDDDGSLDSGDSGTATFTLSGSGTAETLTYIGGGNISLIGIGGVKLFPRPISIFEAGGQLYFYLPNGLPPLTGVTFSIDINANTPTDLPGFVPCFASGTRIMTRRGNRAVEDIRVGDTVIGTDGRHHQVIWRGQRTVDLTRLSGEAYRKLVPVRIRSGVTNGHGPTTDLIVSQQHRILLRHPIAQTLFGLNGGFAAAKSLVGSLATYAEDLTEVTYHHILCAEHVTLLANGVEAESLYLGDVTVSSVRPEVRQEFEMLFPDLCKPDFQKKMLIAHPDLKAYEAQVIAHEIAEHGPMAVLWNRAASA